jgi:hypothetical protein
MQHNISRLQKPDGLDRKQVGIAGTSANQKDFTVHG